MMLAVGRGFRAGRQTGMHRRQLIMPHHTTKSMTTHVLMTL